MADPSTLVDPNCLCGRPHPCDLHGGHLLAQTVQPATRVDGAYLLWLLDHDHREARGGRWGAEPTTNPEEAA